MTECDSGGDRSRDQYKNQKRNRAVDDDRGKRKIASTIERLDRKDARPER